MLAPRAKTVWSRIGQWLGCALMLAPVVGILYTMQGMLNAFQTLGSSGIGDPRQLAGAVGEVIWPPAVGLGLALCGLSIFLFSGGSVWRRRSAAPPFPSAPFPAE